MSKTVFQDMVAPDPGMVDRALGALWGGALGDALGMPTQTLSRDQIIAAYGEIEGFIAPFDDHPVSHGLPAGAITDDTEQSLLLARLLITSKGEFDEHKWVDALIAWERDVAARGLRDLLGPSTKRALEEILQGVPVEKAGRYGNTNGAAMRIAPVGIATPPEPLSGLIDKVEATCRVTHNTGLAIGAASAVAAAISAGLDGASWRDATVLARAAAKSGQKRGHGNDDIRIEERIDLACRIVNEASPDDALVRLTEEIGTDVAAWQSVPAAFGLLHIAHGDVWQAGLIGARMGGDTDTIAAIAAGMAGACCGFQALPQEHVEFVGAVNHLDLQPIAQGLLSLRGQALALPEAVQ